MLEWIEAHFLLSVEEGVDSWIVVAELKKILEKNIKICKKNKIQLRNKNIVEFMGIEPQTIRNF